MHKTKTVIVDSGAYTIKTGLATAEEPLIIPNCIMKAKAERKRLFIGSQIEDCRDCSGLYYLLPCERGYVTRWEVQKPVWDYVFTKGICPVSEKNVVMTQPLFNFKSIQDCTDEIFFEEYDVNALYRCNPTDLASLQYSTVSNSKTCVVVDSGYSFTHVVPYIDGKKCSSAIKRLRIGGKLLTNNLKDILSYRQYHVMEETYVINQVKEDACFISEDFKQDLKTSSLSGSDNHIARNYILPDFNTIKRGFIQTEELKEEYENCQVLRLNNERFTVPEILFSPSDIGVNSVGVVDCIIDSIKACPKAYQEVLAKNIVVVGGNACLSGFRNRLIKEFSSKRSVKWDVGVYVPPNPTIFSWQGGKTLSKKQKLTKIFVTKKEYEEFGTNNKFNEWHDFSENEEKKIEIKPISLIDHVKKCDFFNEEKDSSNEKQDPDTPNESSDKENLNVEITNSNSNSSDKHLMKNSNSVEESSKCLYMFESDSSSDFENELDMKELFPVGLEI